MAIVLMDQIVTLGIKDTQHNDTQFEHEVSLCKVSHFIITMVNVISETIFCNLNKSVNLISAS